MGATRHCELESSTHCPKPPPVKKNLHILSKHYSTQSSDIMKVLLVLTCVIALACSLPIDDPNDQVELVPATRTNVEDVDEDVAFPVLIFSTGNRNRVPQLGTSGFLPFFEAILGGGGNNDGDDDKDRIPSFPPIAEIDLDIGEDALFPPIGGMFGGGSDDDDDDKCGPFCKIFRSLDKQLKNIETQLKEVQANRQNELPSSSEQGDDEGPQTTYEEKVLADGTVVKIRKTSFSDASDDGTSYFGYHSTRVVSSSDESDDDDSVEQVPDDVVQVELDEPKDSKPIKLTKLDNDSTLKRRKRRQTTNPFNQQQVQDLSFFNQVNPNAFNQISQNPFNQVRVQPQLVSPTLVRNLEKPKPISLEGDTRVNDLLLENARRGGLIRIDPDSEFIDGDGTIALSGHSQRGS